MRTQGCVMWQRHEATEMCMSWTAPWHHNRGTVPPPLPQSVLPLKIPVHYQERLGSSNPELWTHLTVQRTAPPLFMKLLQRMISSETDFIYVSHRFTELNLIYIWNDQEFYMNTCNTIHGTVIAKCHQFRPHPSSTPQRWLHHCSDSPL